MLRQAGGPDATVNAVNELASAKSGDADTKTDVGDTVSPPKDEK